MQGEISGSTVLGGVCVAELENFNFKKIEMEPQDNKQIVMSFFETFVEGYILGDLKELLLIKPDSTSGLRGCTIPTAMLILSSMDLFGFLLNEKGETDSSKDNILFFIDFDDFFPHYYKNNNVVTPTKEKLYNYRHGMMHHFFPKFLGKFAGICKNPDSSLLFIPILINGKTEESLNVNVLASDFIQATVKFKEYLLNCVNENVFDTIIGKLKDLDCYIQISSTVTTCTTLNPGTPQKLRGNNKLG